jgi:hypothetical protein
VPTAWFREPSWSASFAPPIPHSTGFPRRVTAQGWDSSNDDQVWAQSKLGSCSEASQRQNVAGSPRAWGVRAILPHVETLEWKVRAGEGDTKVTWRNSSRRELRLTLGLTAEEQPWVIQGILRRRKVPDGAGAISRTLHERERQLSNEILATVDALLREIPGEAAVALHAVKARFDETVVAGHLQSHHEISAPLADWFAQLRRMAEQTYENKALTFGCVIDKRSKAKPLDGCRFPDEFLARKRFLALSDGYRTAYRVSGFGAIVGFVSVKGTKQAQDGFYPEWSEDLVDAGRRFGLAFSLTRQGDILVFDKGRLSFTYRFGHWQYWNHTHIVDLLRNFARAQHVDPGRLATVVRTIYRAALDVAFRRSGGLFILLRSADRASSIVREGDAVGSSSRSSLDAEFDRALVDAKITSMPRAVVAELAAIDGAVVIGNTGKLLAYGAVLDPKRKGRISAAEGSRTKAAIGASYYGLAVKVSSDGDVQVYSRGKKLLTV